MEKSKVQPEVLAVRRFNRFYTHKIGTLQEGLLRSSLSLPEARVLYEIASSNPATATAIANRLNLDAGHLSRILRGFTARRLISRKISKTDGRQNLITLTKLGEKEFAALNRRSNEQVQEMLASLSDPRQRQLVQAMALIEDLLGDEIGKKRSSEPYALRTHRPGDMGWVVHRHGALYAQEYGWDERFEALVARITADFIDQYDPQRERCWIAERDNEFLGCVFLVKSPTTPENAKLRLLLVEPTARGLGVGRTLVHQCTQFARQAGYVKVTLWTNSVLAAARHLYEKEGYRLKEREEHNSFGKTLTGETWELEL